MQVIGTVAVVTWLAFYSAVGPSSVNAMGADAPAVHTGTTVSPGYNFKYWISGPALVNDHYWVLTGTRQNDGACQYEYGQPEQLLPSAGWELRSVAIDTEQCAKLMEEGTPTTRPALPPPSISNMSTDGPASPNTTAYYAWQQVVVKDILNIVLTYDVTQIGWTSNRSTVTSGIPAIYLYEDGDTGWRLDGYQVKHTLASDHSYFLGNTISQFHNSSFCFPLPTVYTFYYYNKVWGFPDGHATRSQSTDSVDECAPLHVDIYSAYGTFQP